MIVALYARVSKEDGQTPENQLDILRDLAHRRGYTVAGEYVDRASGKDANRPEFAKLMDAARLHAFDAVMAVRLDRVMRSVIHLKEILGRLDVFNVGLILSDMEFDAKTPNGRLMINIVSSIAEWEREIISSRTREGLAHRRSKGVKLGRASRDDIPMHKIALLRIEGYSFERISEKVDVPKSTLMDRRHEIYAECDKIRSENEGV